MARTAERFVKAHHPIWARLNDLVDKAQKGRLDSLSDEELHEMGALYRRVAADLARAQTRYGSTTAGRELVRSLNDLVLRAHTQVYSAPTPQPARGLYFVLYGFPAAFRRQWRAIAVAAVLMFGPGLAAYCTTVANPKLAHLFVPDHVTQEVKERAKQNLKSGWGGNTRYTGMMDSPEISRVIMENNILVTVRAVSYGVSMGIGTALVLAINGLLLGGLSGVATNEHVDLLYWAVILPHGVLELSAICIAGGAGLILARALYAPGDLPRLDALKLAGLEAVQLLVGVVVLLVVAGLIEGFITPLPIEPMIKLTFALFTAIALIVYVNLRPPARLRHLEAAVRQ